MYWRWNLCKKYCSLPLQDVTCISSPNDQPLLDVYANNRNRMLTLIPVPLCTTSCISYFQQILTHWHLQVLPHIQKTASKSTTKTVNLCTILAKEVIIVQWKPTYFAILLIQLSTVQRAATTLQGQYEMQIIILPQRWELCQIHNFKANWHILYLTNNIIMVLKILKVPMCKLWKGQPFCLS